MYNFGYNGGPSSAVINTGGGTGGHAFPQRTQVLGSEPTFAVGAGQYNVSYLNPITTQPSAGQVLVAPSRCQAQYPMLIDLGKAYSSSVGGQCHPCNAHTTTTTTTKVPTPSAAPKRVNRCCPGCAPCCCGECDTLEDSPSLGCCGPQAPASDAARAAPQDCCSCHGCQTNCCGQPCCVCQPCQTNNCCAPNQGGCCGPNQGECCGPNQGCCGPNQGCCGPNQGCCGPNQGCCGPNGECCGPNGGCCGNCCQPVQANPAHATQSGPVVTTQPASVEVGPANGPYVYRTSYNLNGFVPYNGQQVSMIPVDARYSWGGAAAQPLTNVVRQVFT